MQNGHNPAMRYAHENALDIIRHMALESLRGKNISPDAVLDVVGYPHPVRGDGSRKFDMTTIVIADGNEAKKWYLRATVNFELTRPENVLLRKNGGSFDPYSTNVLPSDTTLQSDLETGGEPFYRLGKEDLMPSQAEAGSPAPARS